MIKGMQCKRKKASKKGKHNCLQESYGLKMRQLTG